MLDTYCNVVEDVDGDDIQMGDVLRSLVIEANQSLSDDRVNHLVNKYIDAVWQRAKEVLGGA